MEDIMKIVKCLQESDLLIKFVSEIVKNEAKEEGNVGFLTFLKPLAGKKLKAKIPRQGVIKAGESTIRADQDY